jgi:hypothetical protein
MNTDRPCSCWPDPDRPEVPCLLHFRELEPGAQRTARERVGILDPAHGRARRWSRPGDGQVAHRPRKRHAGKGRGRPEVEDLVDIGRRF